MTTANNANAAQDKLVLRIVMTLSIVVFFAVIVLNRKWLPRPDVPPDFVFNLPSLNAIINATCSVLLIASFMAIKKRNIALHKKLNLTTFALSAVFLVSYVLYHFFADETTYPAESPLRPVYLFILFSHIILAALVLPLVLMSFYHGLLMNVEKHRKLVRWTFPIWLYVTVTGVIVYLMISPYYPF
jgi:putative membrane protein